MDLFALLAGVLARAGAGFLLCDAPPGVISRGTISFQPSSGVPGHRLRLRSAKNMIKCVMFVCRTKKVSKATAEESTSGND